MGLAADGLDHGGELCQPQGQGPTDLGRIAGRPGAFDEGTTRMRMPGLGKTALLTPRPTGLCRGRESEIMHERSGVLETPQVSSLHHGGHCDSTLATAQSLKSFDYGSETPGFALRVECECKTSPTFRLCGDGLDVCLIDDLWRRGGHPTSLSQRKWAGLPWARPG